MKQLWLKWTRIRNFRSNHFRKRKGFVLCKLAYTAQWRNPLGPCGNFLSIKYFQLFSTSKIFFWYVCEIFWYLSSQIKVQRHNPGPGRVKSQGILTLANRTLNSSNSNSSLLNPVNSRLARSSLFLQRYISFHTKNIWL